MSSFALRARGLVGFLEGASGLQRVLSGADLDVRQGRTFALLGESGSGKTFLLYSLLGLHAGVPGLVSGDAKLGPIDLLAGLDDCVEFEDGTVPRIRKRHAKWSRIMRRRLSGTIGKRVTLVPQDPLTALSPFHTVYNMLEAAIRIGQPGTGTQEVKGVAAEWLDRVGMYGVRHLFGRYVHELSGGMAQRLALALALAPGPEVLIADEPTTGLDATLRVRILSLLAEAVERYNLTLVLITHDAEAARLLAKDAAVLCGGIVVEQGPAESVLCVSGRPKHPYTKALLEAESCLINMDGQGDQLSFGGVVPAGGACGYRARCPVAGPECLVARPGPTSVGPQHRIACFKVAEVAKVAT